MNRTRVILADDNAQIREVLRRFLECDWEVVGEAGNGQEAIDLCERLQPDVVLLDVTMPVLGGFEAAQTIKQRFAGIRILFVTQHSHKLYAEKAFNVGANGYVLKGKVHRDLADAIRLVSAGGTFASEEMRPRPH